MANKLYITDTILRDGHQSKAATRMPLSDMLPACEALDNIGFWSLEVWGGATFDACLRYLNEDPWERLRKLRKALPKTKLQMLFRGQNILGYKHYADDVVEAFCRKAIENGIDIIRIFDALNDTRNLEADSICIKDMANLLLPYDAYSLVKKMKAELGDIPIHLHTHNTTGTGDMTNLMAAQAGVDIVDTCLSPFGNGTAQPATESLVATLKGTERDTGLDLNALAEVAKHFRKVQERMMQEGIYTTKSMMVDTNTLIYQVPGGMLSNLVKQLKDAGAEDKYYDVLAEIPQVRKDFGYPPLVTPTSQIVGTQAVFNVLMGRYKTFPNNSKDLLRGAYGKVPGEVNEEVRKMAIGDEKVITCRPADLIEPELEKYKKELGEQAHQEEDVLSYALLPQVAKKFFDVRDGLVKPEPEVKPEPKKEAPAAPAVRELYVEDLSI